MGYKYILLHDWEGKYRGIFSSRVAELARPQGRTIHNIPLYCPTQKECNNRFIICLSDSNLVGEKIGRGGEKEITNRLKRKKG